MGVSPKLVSRIWKCKVPLKIRIFLWQAFQDRPQTTQQLKTRKWKCSELCKLCGKTKDINHLLFKCPMAEFFWAFVSESLGWTDYPWYMNELITEWLPQKFGVNYQIGLSCFAGLAWAMWNTRNKICIKHSIPERPIDTIFLGVSFL
jgi:hypothetical protein